MFSCGLPKRLLLPVSTQDYDPFNHIFKAQVKRFLMCSKRSNNIFGQKYFDIFSLNMDILILPFLCTNIVFAHFLLVHQAEEEEKSNLKNLMNSKHP